MLTQIIDARNRAVGYCKWTFALPHQCRDFATLRVAARKQPLPLAHDFDHLALMAHDDNHSRSFASSCRLASNKRER